MVDKSKIVGMSSISTNIATKTETGDWQVVVDLTEKRTLDGVNWEEKKISAMCTHAQVENALQVATNSVVEQMNSIFLANQSNSLFE